MNMTLAVYISIAMQCDLDYQQCIDEADSSFRTGHTQCAGYVPCLFALYRILNADYAACNATLHACSKGK